MYSCITSLYSSNADLHLPTCPVSHKQAHRYQYHHSELRQYTTMPKPLSANARLVCHAQLSQGWGAQDLTNLQWPLLPVWQLFYTTECSAVEPRCTSNPPNHFMLCQPCIAVKSSCNSICPSHLVYHRACSAFCACVSTMLHGCLTI